MASFNRVVRDVVADTVTTNQLFATTATIKGDLTATNIVATTITTDSITIPRTDLFLTDLNFILGTATGATFSFSRVGDAVTVQLDLEDDGTVVNTGFLLFVVPAPYTPTNTDFLYYPITIIINGVYTQCVLAIGQATITISPTVLGVFTPGEVLSILPTSATFLTIPF